MFEVRYKIVYEDYDEYAGENGFLQIIVNEFQYGNIWPDELDDVMETLCLCDWMERLVRVCTLLESNDYVVISDVDSYNTWLEFRKMDRSISVSLVKTHDKAAGVRDIELKPLDVIAYDWKDQVILYEEFRNELYRKVGEYLRYLKENNAEMGEFESLMNEFEPLRQFQNKAFGNEILQGLAHKGDELIYLRKCAFHFKDIGMSEQEMLDNLERLRKKVSTEEEEDVILELMDQIGGCCHSDLRIF